MSWPGGRATFPKCEEAGEVPAGAKWVTGLKTDAADTASVLGSQGPQGTETPGKLKPYPRVIAPT